MASRAATHYCLCFVCGWVGGGLAIAFGPFGFQEVWPKGQEPIDANATCLDCLVVNVEHGMPLRPWALPSQALGPFCCMVWATCRLTFCLCLRVGVCVCVGVEYFACNLFLIRVQTLDQDEVASIFSSTHGGYTPWPPRSSPP